MTEQTQLAGELAQMDFSTLVGHPLKAAIEGQIMASIASADFILDNAFESNESNKLKMVTMEVDQFNSETGTTNAVTLNFPLLSLMTLPSIRIEEYKYNFLAKINGVESYDETKGLTANGSIDVNQRWRKGGARLQAGIAYQKTTSTGEKISREYQMEISVRAVTDKLPGGTEIMLEALQRSIIGNHNTSNPSGTD